MIKVLHVTWAGNFGGIERLVADLAMAQKTNSELEIGIFVSKTGGSFAEIYKKSSSNFHTSNLRSGYDICLWKYIDILKVFRQYDILHFHAFNPIISLLSIFISQRIVYTEHGNFGFGRQKKYADRIKDFLKNRFLRSHVDYITFNSRFTKSYAEKRFKIDKAKRSVVYNGILFDESNRDTDPIDSAVLEILKNKFVVGTSSRFAGFKRIDRLINAFYEFQKSHDAILLLVGDGTLRPELEKMVNDLNLESRTVFTGYQAKVRDYQRFMDVCVFPSQREPFGLVAVETLSLGKPTLVYQDGGGIIEVVAGVEAKDIVEDNLQLVERLKFYFNNRQVISKNIQMRKNYSKRFDIQLMETEICKVYKEVLCMEKGIS